MLTIKYELTTIHIQELYTNDGVWRYKISQADVIVSSDDTGISMGGGISGSILKAGGESIRQDAQKKLPAQIGRDSLWKWMMNPASSSA